MTEPVNPYSAPAARVEDTGGGEAERVRREHLSHEAGLRSLGMLYYLGGGVVALLGIASGLGASDRGSGLPFAVGLFVLGLAQVYLGWGVRSLRKWARWPGVAVSVLGLFGFPVGTLVGVYALWLYLSKKGRTVFTPEYAAVRAATPYLKYRTSIFIWVGLALVVVLAFVVVGKVMVP